MKWRAVIGQRLGRFSLGIALGLGSLSAPIVQTEAATPAPANPPTTYHKYRAFRIPFNIEPADRARYQEVLLYVSSNGGERWEPKAKTRPDQPAFSFQAPRDGEYLFAVRTRDTKGRLIPGDDATIEPSLRVVIDTVPPAVSLRPGKRRGSFAVVQWEIVEENLDPKTILIEYQTEGARNWSKVPLKPARIGSAEWDPGTAEPLKVRASASDLAGNSKTITIDLPEGAATRPASNPAESPDDMAPPPIGTFTAREVERDELPEMPAVNAGGSGARARPGPAPAGVGDGFDPFTASESAEPAPPSGGPGPPLLVASPKFSLQYAVDDAGPSGRPAVVELWITQDGGQTWFRKGEDPDRVSPFPVDLGGEGSFGLKLVARSASFLGDLPPSPGELPQSMVEVDSTPPVVKLDPIKVGSEANAGKIAIVWHASDPHLGGRPVAISVRRADVPNDAWQPIAPAMENTGQFIWTVPPNFPNRFHVRVDVIDTLGNRGFADTTETGPILVDRTRPRGRIIGLDPAHRPGGGPSAHPIR
ncbi:hypothetical protein TA3x_004395 [Tundrisphaera sp. TA3]|uniref:hypothetical protein n=1 Tax=Tundrisphaera sp. TA3 TaxID=3435775 RepID=UPI003EC150DF